MQIAKKLQPYYTYVYLHKYNNNANHSNCFAPTIISPSVKQGQLWKERFVLEILWKKWIIQVRKDYESVGVLWLSAWHRNSQGEIPYIQNVDVVLPGYISIKRGHLRVQFLVTSYESIFVDLPDLPVVVPRTQVVLEISGVTGHPLVNLILDLIYLLISGYNFMDWLE